MQICFTTLKNKFLKDDKGLLNYLTLTSDNEEIQKKFMEKKIGIYNNLAELTLLAIGLLDLHSFFNYIKGDQN